MKGSIGILGDTDGHEDYIKRYVEDYSEVDLLVLHLGTFSNKRWGKGGGHLCIRGVKQVFDSMKKRGARRKKTVVLSEFGLELGTKDQIYEYLEPYIKNYSWRIPLIYTKLAMARGKKKEFYLDTYARASMDLLWDAIEEDDFEKRDEMLCAFGFMVIAIGGNFASEITLEIVRYIERWIDERGGPPGNIEQYLGFKDRCDSKLVRRIKRFFDGFLERVLKNIKKGRGQDAEDIQKKLLGRIDKFIEKMTEQAAKTIPDELRKIGYCQIWDYLFRFSKSINLIDDRSSKWLFKGKIVNYDRFFVAVLMGLVLLYEEIKMIKDSVLPKPEPEENPLIEIAGVFQEEREKWYKVLIGDIGSEFMFDEEGIKTKTIGRDRQIKWLSPEEARLSYDEEKGRVVYAPSDSF